MSKESATKLFEKIGVPDAPDEQKLIALKEKFNWENDFSEFSKYCEENNIETSFSSWSGTDWD